MKLWIAAHMAWCMLFVIWCIWGIGYAAMRIWTKD